MRSINPTIKQALAGCSAPAFFQAWRPTDAYPTLPNTYITYQETLFQRELTADDAPMLDGRYIRVSVWSNADTATVAAQAVAGMEAAGFILRGANDLYEDDTKTYHWASDWVLYQDS